MAKMKVHELAKELDKQSKEVLALLHENGVEVKSHMSSIEDSEIKMVRSKFGGAKPAAAKAKAAPAKEAAPAKAEAPKAETAAKAEAPKAEASEEHKAKKKKKIIFVSNPQNSNNSNRPSGNRQGGNRPSGNRPSGNRPNNNRPNNRPQPEKRRQPIRPTMPGSEDFVELVSKNTLKPTDKKPVTSSARRDAAPAKAESKPATTAPANAESKPAERPATDNRRPASTDNRRPASSDNRRPSGDQRRTNDNRNDNRNTGNRNYNDNRNAGGNRNYNDNRNAGGNRPYNNNNNGGNRNYNDNRNSGGNRNYNDNRNAGGNRNYNDNRNAGGNRPYNNNGGNRSYNNNNSGGNRSYNNNSGGNRSYNNNNNGGNRSYGNNSGGNRPYNNSNGGNRSYGNNSGGNRPYNNNSGGNRNFGNNNAGGYRGQNNRGDAPKMSPDMRREEDKRRIAQNKNHKKRNEKAYTKEVDMRPGRFIKPEKKVETVEEKIKVITLPEVITIRDLASKMKMQPSVIVKKLFLAGKIVTVNQEVTYEEAEEIAMEYEILCEQEVKVDVIAELLKEDDEDEATLEGRAPVVCVMGHVDHGKTSLLDAIKETNVIDKEAGGITQHIGAYTVKSNDEPITFLDTPGHEAFTAMRLRGAKSTDIAVLVVAADDGVMPQTIEAINHARAAEIEIIVAINKIDKPNANVERVKQELSEHELISEEWGGSTIFAEVSAKTGEGIPKLLEMIQLTAEVLELKANPNRSARGVVIEAKLDKGRGSVASLLVQKGTLHVGDYIAVGSCYGKVRAMTDDKRQKLKEAGPSTPVEIIGLNGVPEAGDIFVSPESDKEAKEFAETYISENRTKMLEETKAKMSLDDLFSQIQEGNLKELKLIVKADVQGSVEAIKQSLTKLTNDEVVVKIIHSGVGAINENDVILASASAAIIIGFSVKPDVAAKKTAEQEKVDIRLYSVIYKAIEDVQAAMKGMLDPVYEEKVIGHAEIRQIFKASAIGNIAGSYVLDGVFERGCSVRITREGEQIFEGKLESLKRFKDDVKEVKKGFECGLVFEEFDKFQELDVVEAYKMVEVPR